MKTVLKRIMGWILIIIAVDFLFGFMVSSWAFDSVDWMKIIFSGLLFEGTVVVEIAIILAIVWLLNS